MLKETVTISAALLVLSGCDALMPARESAPARGDVTRGSIEETLQEASASPPPAEIAVRQEAGPIGPIPAEAEAERFDLNSEDTPAQAFFMALVDQTEHNIVVHPDVAGSISLMLQDVTVNEVLELVSEVYGYSFRHSAAGYLVFPATLQSRIFQIDYLNLQRSGPRERHIAAAACDRTRSAAR